MFRGRAPKLRAGAQTPRRTIRRCNAAAANHGATAITARSSPDRRPPTAQPRRRWIKKLGDIFRLISPPSPFSGSTPFSGHRQVRGRPSDDSWAAHSPSSPSNPSCWRDTIFPLSRAGDPPIPHPIPHGRESVCQSLFVSGEWVSSTPPVPHLFHLARAHHQSKIPTHADHHQTTTSWPLG